MVSVKNTKNETLTFSKSSILKILSVGEIHTIYFTDGSQDTFTLNLTDFAVNIINKLS
jgi:hypothetical protein